MKAVVYDGPRQVSVKDVPDARIERPTDALVRITSANICGSDLHMYEGRTDLDPGRFADMGPYGGGQAELLRVPWADFTCLRLGEDAASRDGGVQVAEDGLVQPVLPAVA
jgi:hypothetical protein